MDVLVFGAGYYGKKYLDSLRERDNVNVLAFVDNNPNLWNTLINGVSVISPAKIKNYSFEKIFIATRTESFSEIRNQLIIYIGIPYSKIETIGYGLSYDENDVRVKWLRDFACNHVYKSNLPLGGDVAECGVYMGAFAQYINKYFPDRDLYLFDTFDGFDERELDKERQFGNNAFNDSVFSYDKTLFKGVDVTRMMARMPNPEKCIVRKGYFPETAFNIPDTFAFVNLDMDLYQPTFAALKVFWDRMAQGGGILLHDYFHAELPGVAKAVADFETLINKRICKTPIGDFCSILLIKD